MKFGVCASIEQALVVREAGFDYIECTIDSLEPEKSDSEMEDTLKRFIDCPVPVEAFNIFIPREINVTGHGVNYDRIHRYLDKALERVKKVGGETIVFGSGGARTLPDGFSKDKGEEQIIKFLDIVADYTDPLEITIVIEPLYKKASNLINNVPEAVEIAKKVNRKSIRVLADFFHMMEEGDALEHITQYNSFIRHIHTSDHYRPPTEAGSYPYPQFVECIQQANYDGRVSIECIWDDFAAEAAGALRFVKKQFGK